MTLKIPLKSSNFLLLSLLILLLCLSQLTLSKKVSSHLPASSSPISIPILSETQSTESQTIKPEKKANSDSFMKAMGIMMLAQLKDVSFYSAIIIGFIYNQTFATFSYFFSCILCTLLGIAFVTDLLQLISSVITGIVAAVFYAIFALLTIYLLASMKDPEIMADSVPGATKKNNHEASSQTEVTVVETEPTRGGQVIVREKVVKKGEDYGDEETGLLSGKSQKGVKEKSGFTKFMDNYANVNFFLTQNKRFVYCIIMLFISEISDFILIGIVNLRSANSSSRVMLSALAAYVVMSLVIFIVVLGVKYFMVRKFKINVDQMKFTKYTGCLLLIGLGVVPPIIQITSK